MPQSTAEDGELAPVYTNDLMSGGIKGGLGGEWCFSDDTTKNTRKEDHPGIDGAGHGDK